MKIVLLGAAPSLQSPLVTEDGKRPPFSVIHLDDFRNEEAQHRLQNLVAEGGVLIVSEEPMMPVIRSTMPAHGTVLFSPQQPSWLRQSPFIIVGTQQPAEHAFSMRELSLEGLQETSDSVMSAARQWPTLHISIDLRVLDTPEHPSGMTARELLTFVQRLRLLKNYRSADIHGPLRGSIIAKLAAELA